MSDVLHKQLRVEPELKPGMPSEPAGDGKVPGPAANTRKLKLECHPCFMEQPGAQVDTAAPGCQWQGAPTSADMRRVWLELRPRAKAVVLAASEHNAFAATASCGGQLDASTVPRGTGI